MANDVEHLSMCLFAICVSSLVKCLFLSFVSFLIGLFEGYLRILNTSHLLDIFSQSVACLVIPLSWAFTEQVLNFDV